jgi:beta-lactamase regulating signal transducer with metallopeptidase domain
MDPYFVELLARSPREILAVDIVAKATLVLAAAGAVALALRRSSAASRHLSWSLGLGAALALPVLSLALPWWSWRVLPAAMETVPPIPSSSDSPAPHSGQPGTAPQSLVGIALEEEALLNAGPAGRLPSRPTAASPTPPSVPSRGVLTPSWSWLWAAWLAGAVTVLSAPIAGRIALARWAREAEPIVGDDWSALLRDLSARLGLTRRIALLRSARAAMPMTWCRIRPVVLLPAESESWDVDRRRDVLLHELAHVRRLDCLTQMIARAACAVYWFHPLAWFAERRMRIERERACDDVVLLAGARASDYAGHLLEIARGLHVPRPAALAALAMARPSQLEGRLMAILDPARRRRGPGRKVTASALLVAILLLVPLATLRVGARASAASAPMPGPIADAPPAADLAAPMTISGRVLDPAGKSVPDAAVMVIVRLKSPDRPMLEMPPGAMTAHDGRCDGSGRFRIELPRTTSARYDGVTITALAPGYGIGWVELDPDADQPAVDVALRAEQVIRGRLLDINGQPARGVALRLRALSQAVRGGVPPTVFRPDLSELRWRDSPAWPGPAISDADGRFALRGLGRGLLGHLIIDDPRFTLPATMIQTDENVDARRLNILIPAIKVESGPDPKPIAIALQPPRTITGRVIYADTGQPVPRALITGALRHYEADSEGRFRVPMDGPPRVTRFTVSARSPDGAPYLVARKQGEWPKGAVEQSVDLALPRGVVVRGKVVEEGTGRPVAGAIVRLAPDSIPFQDLGAPAVTNADGTYRVAGPPGPGYVVAQGPSDDYVPREFAVAGGPLNRHRFYAHAYRSVDLKPGGPEQEVDLALRPGAAIDGRVVGPDGQPVRDAWVISRLILSGFPAGARKRWVVRNDRGRGRARDGHFALHGLEPDAEVAAYFLDPERKLGATARLSGRSGANGPITVRLETCGTARARLVGPDGKSIDRDPAGRLASMVVTPGPPSSGQAAKDGPLFAEEASLFLLDPVNYGDDLQSDAQGRLSFPALIPGATYRIVDRTPVIDGGEPAIRKEFTVQPGEALDLGDILIARPRGRNSP